MKSIVIAMPQSARCDDRAIRPLRQRAAEFFRSYGVVMIMLALLASGVVCAMIRQWGRTDGIVMDKLLLPLPFREEKKPITVFADSFCVSFVFAAALCFMALTPAGLPSIPALLFFRGYVFGAFASRLCCEHGFSGLAYCISTVLAGAFLSSLALAYYAQYCMECSVSMLLVVFGHLSFGGQSLRERFRDLMMNGAYILIILSFASLTDTLLWFLIGRLFEF